MEVGLIFGLLASVILFIYGIEHLSRELQLIASDKIEDCPAEVNQKTGGVGAAAGAAATAAIQSSTATTVITVGLVNAGIISFINSLGIVAGANVGTTVTAQLIAFNFVNNCTILSCPGIPHKHFWRKVQISGKSNILFRVPVSGNRIFSCGSGTAQIRCWGRRLAIRAGQSTNWNSFWCDTYGHSAIQFRYNRNCGCAGEQKGCWVWVPQFPSLWGQISEPPQLRC